MVMDRDEILEILRDMGVELPKDTKLPLDALQQRLTRAIDLAQAPLKSKEIDPDALKKWADVSKMRLLDVLGAVSWKEAAELMTPRGRERTTELLNAFMSMRNAVVEIGVNWDDGSKLAVVEDEAGQYGFTMRVVDVYALTDDIPIFTVVYEHGPGSFVTRPPAFNFFSEPCPGMRPGQDAVQIRTTFLAQKLLVKVLEMNAKRLPDSYSPFLRPNEKKHNHKISFLVPIVPLSMREVGGLAGDVGCAVCGKPSKNRCAGCQNATYCSKECQKTDWPSHKRECKTRSLAGGIWLDVTLSVSGYPGMVVQAINAHSAMQGNGALKKNEGKVRSEADDPAPNIHGDTPFVIKIQVPPPGAMNMPVLIYDRRRSFEFYLRREVDPKGYGSLETEARRTGYLGQKIYRYAKRTGDSVLSICLDREPPAESMKW